MSLANLHMTGSSEVFTVAPILQPQAIHCHPTTIERTSTIPPRLNAKHHPWSFIDPRSLLPWKAELLRSLISIIQNLLHRTPLQHALVPSIDVRKILPHIRRRIPHDEVQLGMKGDVAQVGRRTPAADEPLLTGEFVVQHLQDPTRILDVARTGLRVGLDEGLVEDALEDRALGRGLELEPLPHVAPLRQGGEADALPRVVSLEDVIHDGAGLVRD